MTRPRFPRSATGAVAAIACGALVLSGFTVPAAAQTDPTITTTTTIPVGPPTKRVKVLDNFFKPKKVQVVVGTKVTWKWDGVAAHNVTVTNGPQKFKSKTIAKGKFSRTITKPGKYLIVCTIHPGMNMVLRAKNPPPVTTTTIPAAVETQPGA